MLLKIKTEYDEIIMYSSNKDLDKTKIEEEICKIKKEFEEWESKFNQYLLNKKISIKELNYQKDNISYAFQKYGSDNQFIQKRFEDLKEKENIVNEFKILNPHPKYIFENRFKKYGFQHISNINPDINIVVSLEKNEIKLR